MTLNRGVQVPPVQDQQEAPGTLLISHKPDSNDDLGDDDEAGEDEHCPQWYNQASGINRRNTALPLVEAQAIIDRRAPRNASLPPALPAGIVGINHTDPEVMSAAGFTDNIK